MGPYQPQTRWQENHGTMLMVFVAMVTAVGSCVLWYRQNRFVPPRFPEAEAIPPPLVVDGPPALEPNNAITIAVSGAATQLGSMRIAVYNTERDFNQPDGAYLATTVPIANGEATWQVSVDDLPERFAVASYHDENNDEELNRNTFGIPMERYGFSRNARGLTGPPPYKQCVISRPEGGETINIFIR